MVSRKMWNKRSKPETQIMAIASELYNSSTSSNGGGSNGSTKASSSGNNNNQSNLNSLSQRRRYKYPAWKKEEPMDGSMEMMKDDRQYYWCKKCRDGKGLWAQHSTEDHKDDYKKKSKKKKFSQQQNSTTLHTESCNHDSNDAHNSNDKAPESGSNCSNGQVKVSNKLLKSIMKGKNCSNFISSFKKNSEKAVKFSVKD